MLKQTILSKVKNYSVVYYERLKAVTDKVVFCREAFNYIDRLYNLGIISRAEYSEFIDLISKYLKQTGAWINMIRKNFYLDEKTLEMLKNISNNFNISESLVVRISVSKYFNSIKSKLNDKKKEIKKWKN